MPPPPASLLLVAALLAARGCGADPLACQPNAQQPMLPTFHIIGNVSLAPGGNVSVELINDASGVTFANGLLHVWHQCCQNHWDHVVSRDAVRWQRLPPPIQPLTTRTFDGSISLVAAGFGGPVILYDAPDNVLPGVPADKPVLGVARLANASDPYLMTWTRAANNPVAFNGTPIAFPGQVWRNGDKFNFLGQGMRFETRDATFHAWTNAGPFVGLTEHSGDWTVPVPNQRDGTPPPPGSPDLAINVMGGADYILGTYDASQETFSPWRPGGEWPGRVAHLEGGMAEWWGAGGGADNNNRMMIVGWATPDWEGDAGPGVSRVTRLTLVREVNFDAALGTLVANPLPEMEALRTSSIASERSVALGAAPHVVPGTGGGAAASADVVVSFSAPAGFQPGDAFGACVLDNGSSGSGLGVRISINAGQSQYFLPGLNVPTEGCDYNVSSVRYTDPRLCQAACTADAACAAYAYEANRPTLGTCTLKNCSAPLIAQEKYTAGIKAPAPVGSVAVRVGTCAEAMGGGSSLGGARLLPSFPLLAGETAVTLRVLPDRSVADFFVQDGRWSGTLPWLDPAPRAAADSSVLVFGSATASSIAADIDAWSMGCGWLDPSYSDAPTL